MSVWRYSLNLSLAVAVIASVVACERKHRQAPAGAPEASAVAATGDTGTPAGPSDEDRRRRREEEIRRRLEEARRLAENGDPDVTGVVHEVASDVVEGGLSLELVDGVVEDISNLAVAANANPSANFVIGSNLPVEQRRPYLLMISGVAPIAQASAWRAHLRDAAEAGYGHFAQQRLEHCRENGDDHELAEVCSQAAVEGSIEPRWENPRLRQDIDSLQELIGNAVLGLFVGVAGLLLLPIVGIAGIFSIVIGVGAGAFIAGGATLEFPGNTRGSVVFERYYVLSNEQEMAAFIAGLRENDLVPNTVVTEARAIENIQVSYDLYLERDTHRVQNFIAGFAGGEVQRSFEIIYLGNHDQDINLSEDLQANRYTLERMIHASQYDLAEGVCQSFDVACATALQQKFSTQQSNGLATLRERLQTSVGALERIDGFDLGEIINAGVSGENLVRNMKLGVKVWLKIPASAISEGQERNIIESGQVAGDGFAASTQSGKLVVRMGEWRYIQIPLMTDSLGGIAEAAIPNHAARAQLYTELVGALGN